MDVPQAGLMVDHSGALRPVTGIAQSFIAGASLRTGVVSAACGKSLCLAKTGARRVDGRNVNDPGVVSPPGSRAVRDSRSIRSLYFPSVRQFARYKDGQMEILDWQVDGEVSSRYAQRLKGRSSP